MTEEMLDRITKQQNVDYGTAMKIYREGIKKRLYVSYVIVAIILITFLIVWFR